MSIPVSDQRRLCLRSGGTCGFSDSDGACRRVLTRDVADERLVVVGEMAHIVAERPNGPRGDHPLPLDDRNRYENLILLCNVHHQLVDSAPQTFTVERLHAMKDAHEKWVQERLGHRGAGAPKLEMVTDTVYSTLIPVRQMPRYVYGASVGERDPKAVKSRLGAFRDDEMTPFILKSGKLWAFQRLDRDGNPFREIVGDATVERSNSIEWWEDPDRMRWFVYLLNNSLNKLTGRKGLRLDHQHRRYYFPPMKGGKPRTSTHRGMNRSTTSRNLAWRPKRRATGESRDFWLHRAVSLRFLFLGGGSWCLSLRPELRVTKDGYEPLDSDEIGRRVTKRLSRQFNDKLLSEIHFWRDFLSETSPRILFPFGSQYMEVSTGLMSGAVDWPGIPDEHAKAFSNATFEEDLFSWAKLRRVATFNADEDEDEEEEFE